jgi:hypothetical protein
LKRETDENSSVLRSFFTRSKVNDGLACSVTCTVSRSDGQARTAFGAASVDNGATALGFHARAKTVGALATNDGGLISAFHDISKVRKSRLLDIISP